MAYPLHNLLTVVGDLFDGDDQVETWTVNLRFAGSLTTAPRPGDNQAIADAISNWWNGTQQKTITHSGIRILGFKHNAIGVDGKFADPSQPNTYTYSVPVAGNAANTPNLPPQVALVATLTTPRVGKSYRGRLYLPCGGASVQNRFFVASSTPGTIAAGLASLITQLNAITEPSTGTEAAVVSSKGHWTRITGVRVGSVFDTQRRRAKSLYQQYSPISPV